MVCKGQNSVYKQTWFWSWSPLISVHFLLTFKLQFWKVPQQYSVFIIIGCGCSNSDDIAFCGKETNDPAFWVRGIAFVLSLLARWVPHNVRQEGTPVILKWELTEFYNNQVVWTRLSYLSSTWVEWYANFNFFLNKFWGSWKFLP